MDSNLEQPTTCNKELEVDIQNLKRKLTEDPAIEFKHKIKIINNSQIITDGKNESKCEIKHNNTYAKNLNREPKFRVDITTVPSSPKKRLEIVKSADSNKQTKEKFIYGNYSQYYGYRNKDHHDIRLDVFKEYKEIFENKHVLDIGCNSGFITMEAAKQFDTKSIVGLDIDKSLINQAVKNLSKVKKSLPLDSEQKRLQKFPFNIKFFHGNYVLKDDVLLEIETNQFDVILCLSITKWIHLNFGDKGLKQSFKRMFLQLKPKGKLILEAQPFDNYGRRKKMSDTIFKNFKDIKFFPKDFTEYLLSSEVGFSKVELMGVPDHCEKGFKRPIQIFFKS